MASCCPICYRESEAVPVSKQKAEKCQERFFLSLQRYLGVAEESGLQNQLGGIGMVTCGQCIPLMESFCELYHQLTTIELRINWKVETLKNVMRCAQRVPSRMNNFWNFMKRAEASERVDDVIKSRRRLIEKCCQQLSNPLPKLSIEKWKLDEERTFTAHRMNSEPLEMEGSKNAIIHTISNGIQLDMGHPHLSGDYQSDESPSPFKNFSQNGSENFSPVPVPIQVAVVMQTTNSINTNSNVVIECNENEANRSSIGDGKEDKMQDDADVDDEQLSGRGSYQQTRRGDGSVVSTGDVLAPKNCRFPILSQLLNSLDLTTKLEPPADVAHLRHDVIQIQLGNPPELPKDTVSSDVVISHGPHTETPSRLRSTHRCQHCGRTFSSNERLQLHQQEVHFDDDDDDRNDQIESDNDNAHVDGDQNQSDSDSMSCFSSSSSSDEQEDNVKSGCLLSDAVMMTLITNPTCSQPQPQPQLFRPIVDLKPENQLRFKCPDCSILSPGMKDFLLHRKTSKSCKASSKTSANVRVEVLTLQNHANRVASKFVDLLAIIEVPQDIYICKSCGVAVYSFQDMRVHKKLHGTFQCKFCDVTESYAPDLARHECLEHFPRKKANGKRYGQSYNCARCGFACKFPNDYFRHHLSEHLSLTFSEPKCAICKTTSETMTMIHHPGSNKHRKFQIGIHLKTHHDLSNVTNMDALKICKTDNCRAYFLTAEQLTEHQKLRHIPRDKLVKRSILRSHAQSAMQPYYRLKCPDCNRLFHSTEQILIHRKTSDSCSGSYDPSKTVKVEVLIRPDPSNKNLDGDDTAFTSVNAIIEMPQAVFVCEIENCGVVQYSWEDMETHKKLHGAFPCNFCKVEIPFAPNLSLHELKHFKKEKGDGRVYNCHRCNLKCSRLIQYVRHHVRKHLSLTMNEPVCAICKTHNVDISKGASKHTNHFKNLHDLSNVTVSEDIQRCTMANCDAYFLSNYQLTEHLYFRHNIGMGRLGLRLQRKQQASGNPPEQSSKCVKTTEEKTKTTTLHKCRDCGKSYTRARVLRAHRAAVHVDPDKVFACTYPKCSKIFESIKQLKQHQRRGTSYHNELDNRDKEKVYVQCPKCNKSINGKHPNYLATHMKSHERSHFCQLCGKVFKNRPVLEMHLLYHSGPESWKFECSTCGQKTKTKSSLIKHMRRHTNEKPYVCQICGLKYADRHNLRFHVNSKHGDVAEDKAKKIDLSNRMSTKGIKKRKKAQILDKARETEADADDSCDD